MLHLSSRQLYMGPKQRPDVFTPAVDAAWNPGGSVCFDLPSSWRSGKVDLALPRRLRGGEVPSSEGTRKERENQQISSPQPSLFNLHAASMQVGCRRLSLRCCAMS